MADYDKHKLVLEDAYVDAMNRDAADKLSWLVMNSKKLGLDFNGLGTSMIKYRNLILDVKDKLKPFDKELAEGESKRNLDSERYARLIKKNISSIVESCFNGEELKERGVVRRNLTFLKHANLHQMVRADMKNFSGEVPDVFFETLHEHQEKWEKEDENSRSK